MTRDPIAEAKARVLALALVQQRHVTKTDLDAVEQCRAAFGDEFTSRLFPTERVS